MSVENPWIVGSPLPLMSHSVDGFPGLQFSAMIVFRGAAHGSAGAAVGAAEPRVCASGRTPATITTNATAAAPTKK
jgi:hypothetical protein